MPFNKPISQYEIEENIVRLVEELEEETENFAITARDHAKKEALHKTKWAQAYLKAEGSVKERESWSEYRNSDSLFDVKIAEALMKSKREKLHSLRTSIDALRTLAANVRAQT